MALTSPAVLCTDIASVTPTNVAPVTARLSDKLSVADYLPVSMLKDVAGLLSPFLAHLLNRSMVVTHNK